MSESEILRLVVAGIDVACNPDSRIVRQHALNALGHLFRAIGDRDLPGRGRPCPGTRRLQRFPRAVERRRPRHPHPEASQSRVREAAIALVLIVGGQKFAEVQGQSRNRYPLQVNFS